jgi:hypothetical protein
MGPTAYFHSEKVVLRTFIVLKNSSFWVGFEPANLGSNGKHDYTLFGSKREEVMEKQRKSHNQKPHVFLIKYCKADDITDEEGCAPITHARDEQRI